MQGYVTGNGTEVRETRRGDIVRRVNTTDTLGVIRVRAVTAEPVYNLQVVILHCCSKWRDTTVWGPISQLSKATEV